MSSPCVSLKSASCIAKELFSVDGVASTLGSCQDANFKIVALDKKYVLKVHNTETTLEELNFQNAVLNHLSEKNLDIPRIVSLAAGGSIGVWNENNVNYFVRLLTFAEGKIFSEYSYYSLEVIRNFGLFVGKLNDKLKSCGKMEKAKKSQWDISCSYDSIVAFSYCIPSEEKAKLLSVAMCIQDQVAYKARHFNSQVVHGDLAYYNVLSAVGKNGRPYVTGVIDFGDATNSWVVGELAIALTPMLVHDSHCMWEVAAEFLIGYLSAASLNEVEVSCLWSLIVLRSVVLYVSILHQLQRDPGNQYLMDEIVLNRRLLFKVLDAPSSFMNEAIKGALMMHFSEVGGNLELVDGTFLKKPENPLWAPMLSVTAELLQAGVSSAWYQRGNWLGDSDPVESEAHNLLASGSAAVVCVPFGSLLLHYTALRSLAPPETCSLETVLYSLVPISLLCPCATQLLEHDASCATFRCGDRWVLVVRGKVELGSGSVLCRSTVGQGELSKLSLQLLPVLTYEELGGKVPSRCAGADAAAWRRLFADVEAFLVPSAVNSASNGGNPLSLRYAGLASMQEHYFRSPPVIERGFREFLYDRHGRSYLDMVNNVTCVGHCHPRVADVAFAQLSLLNTNSRFVYSALGEYVNLILSRIPQDIRSAGKLNTVFLVNSGSEATDLALRIARSVVTTRMNRTASERCSLIRDVMCLEGAYHGVTTASDEVSTTLNDNPHSLSTRAPWIHLVPMPNLFRGRYKVPVEQMREPSVQLEASVKYAGFVSEKLNELKQQGRVVAGFIAEPLSGNAGGVELPAGYLQQVYGLIRAQGGLCICDEVQVGYGRLGSVFWGFQEHGVVPDIITMAKATGNGQPIGFVVTSKEIAADFREGEGSFFSSAGGNPVSCMIGQEVLKIIADEQLQQQAATVGGYLHEKLQLLRRKHSSIVGCIHGHGLYQGIELARASPDGEFHPATEEAYAICERLLELGVICHNTGDYSNVLKVKPPLCFNQEDADFFVQALDLALQGW